MDDEILKTIKDRLSMSRYVGANKYIKCPANCTDDRNTCQVYDDGLRCHKCHHREDVFDFLQRTRGVDFRTAKQLAARDAGVPLEANKERSALLVKCVKEFHEQLFIHQPEKLEELILWRGWSRRIIGTLRLGYCDPEGEALKRTGIPMDQLIELGFYARPRGDNPPFFIFKDRYTFGIRDTYSNLISIKGRLAPNYTEEETKELRKTLPLLAQSDTWGQHSHMDHLYLEENLKEAEERGFIIITEGEPNAVSLRDHGFPVVALQTNKGLAKFAYRLRNIQRVYVCLDNDEETLKTLLRECYQLQLALPNAAIRLVTLPYLKGELEKVDVDEYFHKFGQTTADFVSLLKSSPDASHVIIREWGKKPPYAMLYTMIHRMRDRRDELLPIMSEVTGYDSERLAFAIDTSQLEEKRSSVS